MKRIIRYQGAIIQGDCLLLIRFRDPVSERTFWLIPGGGLEPDESEEACVRREMREETNLEVHVERLLFEDDDAGGFYQRRKTYLCRIQAGTPSPGDEPEFPTPEGYGIIETGWFPLGQPEMWSEEILRDSITYPLLLRIRQALGYAPSLARWFEAQDLENITPIVKDSADTRAWFATDAGGEVFLKFYPQALQAARSTIEISIAGGNLHPAIVPLRQTIPCREGMLLLYDRVPGENLGATAARQRFQALPLSERITAVLTIIEALAVIGNAGFIIVDWYEGNMIYDFGEQRIHLFDWDLCRKGHGFTLEMDANYGSSRLMAPEEFVRGSWVDHRTLVFNLGRYVLLTVPELAEILASILARATYPARSERYPSIQEFASEFARALAQVDDVTGLKAGFVKRPDRSV